MVDAQSELRLHRSANLPRLRLVPAHVVVHKFSQIAIATLR